MDIEDNNYIRNVVVNGMKSHAVLTTFCINKIPDYKRKTPTKVRVTNTEKSNHKMTKHYYGFKDC